MANGILPEHLAEQYYLAVDTIGRAVVRHWMRLVGVPVETGQLRLDLLNEPDNGESIELVKVLASIDDAQVSFRILRLSQFLRLLC